MMTIMFGYENFQEERWRLDILVMKMISIIAVMLIVVWLNAAYSYRCESVQVVKLVILRHPTMFKRMLGSHLRLLGWDGAGDGAWLVG